MLLWMTKPSKSASLLSFILSLAVNGQLEISVLVVEGFQLFQFSLGGKECRAGTSEIKPSGPSLIQSKYKKVSL